MTTQHSGPPRDPTHERAEVLSDATDLDALLEAILGDELAPVTTQSRPPDKITAPALGAEAPPRRAAVPPPRPAAVPSPPPGMEPEPAFASKVVVADHDAWGFVSEDAEARNEVAPDLPAVRHEARAPVAAAGSSATWREKLRVSWSRQSLLVAALSAAALISASAISLRDEPTPTPTVASPAAPAPVELSPPVQGASAIKVTNASQVEVWAAAREPEEPRRVVSRTPSRRSNGAADSRRTAPAKPAVGEAPRNVPTTSPVVAPPLVVERITEPTDREAAPSRTAIPAENEQRRMTESAPDGPAMGATVVNTAGPALTAAAPRAAAPTAAASLPAAVPRQTVARLLTGPAPEYPSALRTARIGGNVEVLLTIDANGRVVNARSLTGHPQLRSAAEAAAKRWRYEAARLDNGAVETQTIVRFSFDPSTDRRPQE